MSKRRIVDGPKTSIQEALEKRKKRAALPAVKPEHKPLSSEAQLERNIYLTNLALNKYQVKLEDGDELVPEEERVFMSLLDTVRKQEATLMALRAKQKEEHMGPVETAKALVDTGMEIDAVIDLYPGNKAVESALSKMRQSNDD
jgi:hypothetical protein